MQIVNRVTKEIIDPKEKGIIRFMYEKKGGRALLKVLSSRVVANIVRGYMKSVFSIPYPLASSAQQVGHSGYSRCTIGFPLSSNNDLCV